MTPLGMVFITSTRTEYALATIEGLKMHLKYDGEILWYIAGDHTNDNHMGAVLKAIDGGWWHTLSAGYGGSVNRAWAHLSQHTPVTLWMEDDWVLRHDLEITPYVNALLEREDVGCVRLGHLPVGLNLESVGHSGHMYLNVKKTTPYVFSGNPHLKHTRFMSYGMYPVGPNPGDTEIQYDHQVRTKEGSAIWWPLLIGDNPPFGHIGAVKSYDPKAG